MTAVRAEEVAKEAPEKASCRLLSLLERSAGHPAEQALKKIERCPNLAGAFPHEDALFIANTLSSLEAKTIIRALETPVL